VPSALGQYSRNFGK